MKNNKTSVVDFQANEALEDLIVDFTDEETTHIWCSLYVRREDIKASLEEYPKEDPEHDKLLHQLKILNSAMRKTGKTLPNIDDIRSMMDTEFERAYPADDPEDSISISEVAEIFAKHESNGLKIQCSKNIIK